MARSSPVRRRSRGSIDLLPSGALRVRVYGGKGPVTGRRHDIGPEGCCVGGSGSTRLLNQVDERRSPRTSATVDQMQHRYFEVVDLEQNTITTYVGYATRHIRPLIGKVKVGELGGDVFDSLYAELRRCRSHCDRRPYVEHRTLRPHACDERCARTSAGRWLRRRFGRSTSS